VATAGSGATGRHYNTLASLFKRLHLWLAFRGFPVRILAGTPTMVTKVKFSWFYFVLQGKCRDMRLSLYTPWRNREVVDGIEWSASRINRLSPGNPPPPGHLLNRRRGGPESWRGCLGKEKKSLSLPGVELRFLGRPACSLVVMPTELSREYTGIVSRWGPIPVIIVILGCWQRCRHQSWIEIKAVTNCYITGIMFE
jgi:hypothetical protein